MTDATEITNIVFSALSDRKGFDDWFDQIDEELQSEIKAEIAEAIAALRAQPDQIVDASEMVDHSELVNRLRHVGDDHIGEVCMVCHEAADALEAIVETK